MLEHGHGRRSSAGDATRASSPRRGRTVWTAEASVRSSHEGSKQHGPRAAGSRSDDGACETGEGVSEGAWNDGREPIQQHRMTQPCDEGGPDLRQWVPPTSPGLARVPGIQIKTATNSARTGVTDGQYLATDPSSRVSRPSPSREWTSDDRITHLRQLLWHCGLWPKTEQHGNGTAEDTVSGVGAAPGDVCDATTCDDR